MTTDLEQLAASRMLTGRLHEVLSRIYEHDAKAGSLPSELNEAVVAALNFNEPEVLALLQDVRFCAATAKDSVKPEWAVIIEASKDSPSEGARKMAEIITATADRVLTMVGPSR